MNESAHKAPPPANAMLLLNIVWKILTFESPWIYIAPPKNAKPFVNVELVILIVDS